MVSKRWAALLSVVVLLGGGALASANPMFAASRAAGTGYTANLTGINGVVGQNASSSAAAFFTKVGSTGTVGASYGSFAPPEYRSFCIDLAEFNNSNVDLANVSITAASPVNDSDGRARNLGAAGWIVNTFALYKSTGFNNNAWAGLFVAAGLTAGQIALVDNNMKAAIMQTAVWAKGYSVNGASITGGANPGIANTLLAKMLALSTGNSSAAEFIDYPPPAIAGGFDNQDMLRAVPEPSSLAIAGLGALAFAGYGWRRRRKS